MFGDFSFLELLTLLMFGALFFKDLVNEWIRQQLGLKPSTNGNGVEKKMDLLLQHFNHETTEQNNDIKTSLDKFANQMEKHDDLEKETLGLLKEIKEYGVPCRPQK